MLSCMKIDLSGVMISRPSKWQVAGGRYPGINALIGRLYCLPALNQAQLVFAESPEHRRTQTPLWQIGFPAKRTQYR